MMNPSIRSTGAGGTGKAAPKDDTVNDSDSPEEGSDSPEDDSSLLPEGGGDGWHLDGWAGLPRGGAGGGARGAAAAGGAG